RHFIAAFATLSIPSEVKTDNSPAYTFRRVATFFSLWGITHKTCIPYSSTGQYIIEWAHGS
ncbi:POK18 protein, partial [Setophaga kirtlandii]|nr:POK18 protein [Setophaga kirtlandii]